MADAKKEEPTKPTPEEKLAAAEAEVDALVKKGLKALDDFEKLDQKQVDRIVAKASVAALNKHLVLAKMAVEETGRGLVEDKATKNIFACEHVTNYLAGQKTVGIIREDDVMGIDEIAEPVGVVGSRGVSEYGRQSAHELAKQAARAGHLIVSGGALGTDAAAHWGAIQAMDEIGTPLAGRTVAVFAGGLNYIGPKSNERLFETIINHSGALISELCPGTVPEARRFLIRNRLIAALSSTLIVAQARARSGALNTAGWANELNRRVFAVPGDVTMPHNTGCNRLIQEGQASIICSLTDIDEFCHAAHRPQSADAADNDDEPSEESTDTSLSQPTNATAAILKAIRTCSAKYGHVSTDGLLAILAESNPGEYSISRISMELGLMELNGLICTQHGNITITDASAT